MTDRSVETRLGRAARVLIVDDHPLMRAGLSARISDAAGLAVCGEADDVAEALELADSKGPDLAIIDISLKESCGLDLIKAIKSRFPAIKMLVLSAYKESLYAERALRAGAMGYLNKQETDDKILEAIEAILAGDRFISDEVSKALVARAIGDPDVSRAPSEVLSDRELQVFRLIGDGQSTASIARRLHLSPHTVDTHREKIKQKLGLRNVNELRREATRWVVENP